MALHIYIFVICWRKGLILNYELAILLTPTPTSTPTTHDLYPRPTAISQTPKIANSPL